MVGRVKGEIIKKSYLITDGSTPVCCYCCLMWLQQQTNKSNDLYIIYDLDSITKRSQNSSGSLFQTPTWAGNDAMECLIKHMSQTRHGVFRPSEAQEMQP